MVLSVSRRTDIPNYYSDWFYNRLRDGFVCVRNPMNPRQVSRIDLSPDTVDCIVFWTKNPRPMLERIGELADYPFYVQFTLTGYGPEIEPHVPHKKNQMIPVFQRLSDRIGSNRVVWRYDPIFFTDVYTESYHLRAFEQIAEALNGFTRQCVISFADSYACNRRRMAALNVHDLTEERLLSFAGQIGGIAQGNQMRISSCAEKLDLQSQGITHGSCIDRRLIEEITGCPVRAGKDKNQRKECGCLESIDVGAYHTCPNGCIYCYANHGKERVRVNHGNYDPDAPMLCSAPQEGDRLTQRRESSRKETQLGLAQWSRGKSEIR